MLGLSVHGSTNTNQLQINIPDELKGVELQIIILPAVKMDEEVTFFTDEELNSLSHINLGKSIPDKEDYNKW